MSLKNRGNADESVSLAANVPPPVQLFPRAVHICEAASRVVVGTGAVHVRDAACCFLRLHAVHVVQPAGRVIIRGHPIQVCDA